MRVEDLKVENASVRVSNAKEVGGKYKISANFRTSDAVMTNVENGTVMKENEQVASFYANMNMNNATTVTYYGETSKDIQTQCEVNALIYEFVGLAVDKVKAEANE